MCTHEAVAERERDMEQAHELFQTRPAQRSQSDLEAMSSFIRQTPGCLSLLDPKAAQILCRHLGCEIWKGGKIGIREGQITTAMYVVVEGNCDVYQLSEEDAKKHAARRTKIDGGLAENGRHASLAGGGRMYSFRRGSMTDVGRERSGTDIAQDSDAFSDLNLGDHICWIGQGESFAEIALLNAHKPAPYSVMAGNSGVRVLTLERASYAHLLSQAKASPDVAVCIKALHGAMCLRPLRTSAGLRSEADVSLLTDILQTMDAFRNMPRDLCLNLAEGMVHVRAPAGASIMEEGDAGDCMYILLSGSVEVRQQQVPEGLDLDTDYCENSSLVSGFTYNTKATKRTRVSALAPASGMGRSNPSGVRSGEKDHHFESAVEKHAIISVMDEEADKAGMVKHDGNYWVNKFMEGVRKAIPAQEQHSGSEQTEMTPLAAIAAAKWRWMTFEQREEMRLKQEAAEWERRIAKEEELREAGAFHAVLGLGAAKAVNKWRQQALAARKADEEMLAAMERDGEAAKADVPFENQVGGMCEPPDEEPAAEEDESDKPVPSRVMARKRWGNAGMAVHFTVKAQALIDPNRRLLDRMAKKDPRGMSDFMANELSRRADIDDVLRTVCTAMMRKGAPRKMSIGNSRKLYEAVTGTINRGASDRGFANRGGDNRSLRSLRFSQGSGDMDTVTRASSIISISDHPDLEEVEEGNTDAEEDRGAEKGVLTRDVLANMGVPLVGVGLDGKPVKRLLNEDPDVLFGSVIRILTPGASFGELSLLQKNVSRTATILVPSNGSCKEARHLGAARDEESNEGHGESNADVAAPGDAAPSNRRFDGVELIRVTRECYDRTVSQLMSKQLADLLEFLSQVEPFKGLPHQHLSSLAVFVRPISLEKGTVVFAEGQLADKLYVIREGEVRLLGRYADGVAGIQTMASAPKWQASYRTQVQPQGEGQQANAARMRALAHKEDNGSNGHASTQANAGSRSAVVRRWGGSGGLNGAGIVVQGGAEVTGMSRLAPLAVLGVGQTFGEELLGTDPSAAGPEDEDEFQPQTYRSTVVVTSLRVHMLEISSRDLRRFGRKAVDAVQHYTRLRSRWHMQRLESCIAATAAAAEAIVKLSQAEPNDQRPKTPDKEESSPLGPRLISAQAMMARRRSDSGPGVAQGSRLSMDLPPQLGRALKPPPEQRGRFPQLRHMSGDSERTVNRIWSMPAQRAPAPAVLNQRRFSMGAAEIDNTLKPIAEAQAETRAMLARGLDSEVLAPLSQHYTMHSLEFPPIKGASKDLRPQGRGKHPADASPEESDLSSPPETPNSKRRPWAPVGSSRQGTSSSRSPASNGNKGKLSHGRVMLESARSKSIAGAEQDPKIRIEGTRA